MKFIRLWKNVMLMTDFERALVRAFNEYFESNEHPYNSGLAARDQQNKWQNQVTDVMLWKPDAFIECKSLKTKSTGGVGFREHFKRESEDSKHQIERATELLDRAGVKGVLALELKRGRGKQRKAYLVNWNVVYQRWNDDDRPNSIRFHELEELTEYDPKSEDEDDWVPDAKRLPREEGVYKVTPEIFEWFMHIYG